MSTFRTVYLIINCFYCTFFRKWPLQRHWPLFSIISVTFRLYRCNLIEPDKKVNLETLSDEELMTQVREGKLDQLVPLFDRYQKPLYNFFLRLTSDEDASEDLVQNLFIRVMKYRKSYKGEHKFRTWIYQMGRNLFYDHYRKEVKTKEGFVDVNTLNTEIMAGDESYQEIEDREERLRLAMEQLPDDKKELLIMSKFQGMKYEEIAKVTDMTLSNVKVKVHRAINSLREVYFQTSDL